MAELELLIIGLGIKLPGHITIEAREALAKCQEIYSIVQESSDIWLPSAQSKKSKTPVFNLIDIYTEGAFRRDNYDRAVSIILKATERISPIGYVTYGNPMYYDSIAQGLFLEAHSKKLSFTVIPGISSIDTLLCDLGRDLAPGIQIYEASWLFGARIPLRTDVSALLVQLGTFGSFRTRYRKIPSVKDLTDLQLYLLEIYPEDHEIYIVRSANRVGTDPVVACVPLGKLNQSYFIDLRDTSMLIPALREAKISDALIDRLTGKKSG